MFCLSILKAIVLLAYQPICPVLHQYVCLFVLSVSFLCLFFSILYPSTYPHAHTHTLMSHMYIVLHCALNPAGLTSPRGCFIWGSRAGADGAMYWWLLSRGFGLCTHKRLCCRLGMGICALQPWWLCFCWANGRISMHILMPQYPQGSLYLLWLFLGSRSSRDRDWQTQFGPGTLWQPHPLSAPVDSCQPCPPGQPGVKNHRVHLAIFPPIHQQKAELNKSCFGYIVKGSNYWSLSGTWEKRALKLGASLCIM